MSRISFVVTLLLCSLFITSTAHAGDPLSEKRDNMRRILKVVSTEISKNFYDPGMKGVDWKAYTDQARDKIDKASSLREMEAAIYELTDKLDDSHTFFIPPMTTVESKYGFDVKPYGDEIRVYDVDPKGAAAKAGLEVGDRVRQIAGYEAERDSVFKVLAYARLYYSVNPLQLIVQRQNKILTIDVTPKTITRQAVIGTAQHFSALYALIMDDYAEWQKHATFHYGMKDNIGYFQVREFPDEGRDFLVGIAEKTIGSRAVIIDLRDCPGGVVDTLLAFAGSFQDTDSEMATATDRKKTKPLMVKAKRPFIKQPLFVLVDSTTASAAELFARHLQKNRKAVIIGDHTMGAVTMAQSFDEELGAGMVLSYGITIGTAKIVLPDGEVLEKKGVIPDVPCLPTQDDMRNDRDTCLEVAYKLAKEATQPALIKTAAPAGN